MAEHSGESMESSTEVLLPRQDPPSVTRFNRRTGLIAVGGFLLLVGLLTYLSPNWGARANQAPATPQDADTIATEPTPPSLITLPDHYPSRPPSPPVDAFVPPPTRSQHVPPPARQRSRSGVSQSAQPKYAVTSPFPPGAPSPTLPSPDYQAAEAGEGAPQPASFVNKSALSPSPGRYAIMQGSIIPVLMVTQPNSDICGDFLARVSEPVYDSRTGHYLLIPQGTTIVGTYECQADYGDRLIPLASTRMIFPNATSMSFDDGFPLASPTGTPGLKGRVNNHWGRVVFAVLATAVLNTGSRFAAGTVGGDRGYRPEQDLALQASEGFGRAGERILQRELNVAPTIEAYPGQQQIVFVRKDLLFPQPYQD